MGRRGPPKTPTPALKLVGSWRAAAREGREPKPDADKPVSQIPMSESEQTVYDGVCDLLAGMGLQAKTDGNAIARYAKNLVLYNTLCEFCLKHGESFPQYEVSLNGSKKLNGFKRFAQSQHKAEVEMMLIRLEREFGLTPAARASLQVTPQTAPVRMRRQR